MSNKEITIFFTTGIIVSVLIFTNSFLPAVSVVSNIREGKFEKVSDSLFLTKIDNCEYVVYHHRAIDGKTAGGITHKGNCKNPEHKQSK